MNICGGEGEAREIEKENWGKNKKNKLAYSQFSWCAKS
jgi:hypothetical protein